jgi:hypothetical protein
MRCRPFAPRFNIPWAEGSLLSLSPFAGRVLLPILSFSRILAAAAGHGEQRPPSFSFQVLLPIAVGRLLGEWMQRIGQPAVIGQLLAGSGAKQ